MKIINILLVFLGILNFIYSSPVIETVSNNISFNEFFGIGVQFIWFNSSVIDEQISLIKSLGIQWIRADIHWDLLEPNENQYQWQYFDTAMNKIKDNNLKSIVYLVGAPKWISSYNSSTAGNLNQTDAFPPSNNTVYAERIDILNNRYPFVNFWEVWNEQNLVPAFWAPIYNATQYNDLFQETKVVFNGVNKSEKLAVGGLGYYGVEAGGANMVADLIQLKTFENVLGSYHPYTDYPEGGGQLPSDPYAHIATSRYLNLNMRTIGKSSQVWATEWGWSSLNNQTSLQADYTVKRLLIDTLVNFNKTFLFTTSDLDDRASSDRDKFYGIIDLKLQKKPVYYSLENLLKITGNSINQLPNYNTIIKTNSTQLPNDLVAIFFQKSTNNTNCIAFWSPSNQKVTMELNTSNQSGVLYQITNNKSNFINGTSSIQLSISSNLQIFEWPIEKDPNPNPETPNPETPNPTESNEISFSSRILCHPLLLVILFIFLI